MYLMSLCNAQVLANSSFSISASLFNKHPDKILIAPNTWGIDINKKLIETDWIEPCMNNPKWITLHCKTGKQL